MSVLDFSSRIRAQNQATSTRHTYYLYLSLMASHPQAIQKQTIFWRILENVGT